MEERLAQTSTNSMIPETTAPKGWAGRNSISSTTPRSSPLYSSKDDKILSRYLRAPTGSCHDFCKYGHRNSSEEEGKYSGARRKKPPTQVKPSNLQKSDIFNKSKDTKQKTLLLSKSSTSLPETRGNGLHTASLTWKDIRPYEVTDKKSLTLDDRKKRSLVEPKALSDPRKSSGMPKFEQKIMMPVKNVSSAKSKLVDKTSQEKPNTLAKSRLAKQTSMGRPTSSSLRPQMTKQMCMPSRRSNDVPTKPLISFKDKDGPRAKLNPQSATASVGMQRSNMDKAGRTLKGSSTPKVKKKATDISGASFSTESEFTAPVEIQEDGWEAALSTTDPNEEKTLYVVEPEICKISLDKKISHDQQLSEQSLSVEGPTKETWSAPEEPSASNLAEEGAENIKNDKVLEGEDHLPTTASLEQSVQQASHGQLLEPILSKACPEHEKAEHVGNGEAFEGEYQLPSTASLEQSSQQASHGQELEPILSKSGPEHEKAECISNGEASEGEDNVPIDKAIFQPLKQSSPGEDVEESESILTEPRLKIEGAEDISSNESPSAEGNGPIGDDKSQEMLALDEKHVEESEHALTNETDSTSANVAESTNSDKTLSDVDNTRNATAIHPESQALSHELLEEPASVLDESDSSTLENGKAKSAKNGNFFESEESNSRAVTLKQLPEELSSDEFTEESDFELSESDESGSENGGAESKRNEDKSLKVEGRRSRSSALHLEGDAAAPYKMKFKRGKIVELLPPDSNGPRRLKFRRRVVKEVVSNDGQLARRIYKRMDAPVSNKPNVEAPGVKLRHQDAQGKKDAQGLFNNVIEETASKLVEFRKSKVKALVGAFETVISLQDAKPASTPQGGSSQVPAHGDGEVAQD